MKKYLCLLILVFGSFSPIFAFVDYQGCWLHTYIDQNEIIPGDTLTFTSEIFWKGAHLSQDLQLSIRFYDVADETIEEVMIRQQPGIYTCEFTLPSSYEKQYLDVRVKAYDGLKILTSVYNHFLIDVIIDTNILPTTRSSLSSILPGDLVWVITHVPEQLLLGLSSASIDIDPSFLIFDPDQGDLLYETNDTDVVITQIGEGFYKSSWYLPSELLDNSSSPCSVRAEVIIRYQSKEYETSYSIPIKRCTLIIKGTIRNYSSAKITVLALDSNNEPISDVIFNLTFAPFIKHQGYLKDIWVHTNPTDSTGQSLLEINFSPQLEDEKMTMLRVEAETLSEKFFVSKREYIYTFDYFTSSNSIQFSLSGDHFRYFAQYYNKGLWLEFQLLNGTNIIPNKEVYVYCGWNYGILKNYAIQSDMNGMLRLKIDWPSNIKVGQFIDVGLYITVNETESFAHQMTFVYNPTEYHTNENPFPKIVNITDYSTYKVYELEWEVPVYLMQKLLIISCKSNFLFPEKLNSSLFFYNSRTLYPNNYLGEAVSLKTIVDSEFLINYLEYTITDFISLYSYPLSRYRWFMDAEGNGLILPEENTPSGIIQILFSEEAMNLYPRLFIFGTIVLVILALWKRQNSMI